MAVFDTALNQTLKSVDGSRMNYVRQKRAKLIHPEVAWLAAVLLALMVVVLPLTR